MTDPMSSIAAIKGSVASAPPSGNQAHQAHHHHVHEAAKPHAEAARPPRSPMAREVNGAAVAQTQASTQAIEQDVALNQIVSIALKGAVRGNQNDLDGQKQNAGQPERVVADAFKAVKDYLGSLPSELQFDYDEEAGRQVFRVVNPVTHEVVKQYPPDEFLEMIKRLKELDKNADDNGMLFDDRS